MTVLIAFLAALAVWLLVRPASHSRLTAARRVEQSAGDLRRTHMRVELGSPVVRWCGMGIAALAAWLLIGGLVGVAAAVAILVVGPRILARLESGTDRRRKYELAANAPLVADIFAACLAAGSSPAVAARASARAVGGAVAELLEEATIQFQLGAPAEAVWKPLLDAPETAPIARAILRSAYSGAPLTDVLLRVADDMRAHHRSELEQAAKSVGVKAVAPLGLCFLPAFMILGVLPLIASLVARGLF